MRAGGLRLRFSLEQDVGGAATDIGGRFEDWQEVDQIRARAAFKGGKEYERAKQTTAELTHLFIIRYQSNLDANAMHHMRLRSLDTGAIYRVHYAVDPDHKRRQIHIHASESQT